KAVTLREGMNEVVVLLRSKPKTSLTLSILGQGDTTPPVITAIPSPQANPSGWNNTTVTVTFSCSDNDSGIAICPGPVTVSTEGAHQVITGTAVDKAGNSASATVSLNIDKTRPIVPATATPAANANGWNNGPVVVTFAATDALSSVAPGTVSGP